MGLSSIDAVFIAHNYFYSCELYVAVYWSLLSFRGNQTPNEWTYKGYQSELTGKECCPKFN